MIRLMMVLFMCSLLSAKWHPLPYKPLVSDEVTLHYVRAINDRFPKMDSKQLEIYLKEASRVVYEHFAIRLNFQQHKDLKVSELFAALSDKQKSYLNQSIAPFKSNSINKKRLIEDLHENLKNYQHRVSIEDMVAFSRPYLSVELNGVGVLALAEALIETEIERLREWMQVLAKDNKPIIDESPYNEWSYWDSLGYTFDTYDIVITNQLIASAEYYGQDMHSALRGGIVAGTTSYRKNSPYDAFVFATTFLFINDDSLIQELRGGQNYTSEEAARYAGAYLAHEIGHMLLRLGHPFGNKHCVMAPAQLLYFKQWYHNIDASKCRLGSEQSMTPGNAVLTYDDLLMD